MAFSDFTLRSVLETFALTEERNTSLFSAVPPLEPGGRLRDWLGEYAPIAVGINTERARREFLIMPVLAEVRRQAVGPVNILPGVTPDVDRSRGLAGFCDYVITRSAEYYFLRGPLVAVVEAKREDVIGGLGQCAASMVALREFNERDGTPVPAIYGLVTSGTNWHFLQLAGSTLAIDRDEYHVSTVGKILGILVHLTGTGVRAAA